MLIGSLHPLDLFIIVGYLVTVVYIGKRASKATQSEEGFFLAGRKLTDEDVLREAAESIAHVARPLQNTDFSMSWRKQAAREFAARALRNLLP